MRDAVERISTGITELDRILGGGIPKGFFVAVTGEPGTGKTILCLCFAWKGIQLGEKVIYVTTEESRESIVAQAEQFNMDFSKPMKEGLMVIIDALMGKKNDKWMLNSLNPEELVEKVVKAKKHLGYGDARLIIDSLSAFWLDKPALSRKFSYFLKKVLSKWGFTVMATSQYAITTSEAFGWGIEHVADGIIRFRRSVKSGFLRRYLLVEKMRQTPHDLKMYEVKIKEGVGLRVVQPVGRVEDIALPSKVTEKIIETKKKASDEVP